jgi:nucleoside-diphosphate-sugar epimerase
MILVTGGTGLLGSHLLYYLLLQGHQVKVLVRPTANKQNILSTFGFYTNSPEHLYNKLEWVEGDVTDIYSLSEAFDQVEYVYHTAACVSFNPADKKKIYETNVHGTANVVNLCLEKSVRKLCFVSSIASLGITEDGSPVHENVLWKPTKHASDYSVSKFKSEMEVWRGIAEGLDAVIVNPSIILGPGNWDSGSSSFFSIINQGFKYYTNGTNGYVDVRDVAKSMITLMESDISGERFLVTAENLSYKELFTKIAEALHVAPPRIYACPFLSNIACSLESLRARLLFSQPKITKNSVRSSHKKLSYSNLKIHTAIGIEFRPIENSIREIAAFYKAIVSV